jgi:hypothetical protein
MRSKITTSLVLLAASLLASGCFVQIEVGPGGHVETKSGAYFCEENSVCMVTIADYLFFEEFVAVPNESYFFRGWKHGISETTDWYRLCPNLYGPCELGAGPYSENALAQAIIDEEAIWVLEPDFVLDVPEDLFESWFGEWRGHCGLDSPSSPSWVTIAPCTELWCPAEYIVTFNPEQSFTAEIFAIFWENQPGPYSLYFDWSIGEGQSIYSDLSPVNRETVPVRGFFSKDRFEIDIGIVSGFYHAISCQVSRNDGDPEVPRYGGFPYD